MQLQASCVTTARWPAIAILRVEVASGGVQTARELVPDLGRVKSIGMRLRPSEGRRDRAWLFFPARTQSTLRRWSIRCGRRTAAAHGVGRQ